MYSIAHLTAFVRSVFIDENFIVSLGMELIFADLWGARSMKIERPVEKSGIRSIVEIW